MESMHGKVSGSFSRAAKRRSIEVADDLRLYADQLDFSQFQALAPGLGIGELVRKDGSPRSSSRAFAREPMGGPLSDVASEGKAFPQVSVARFDAPAPRFEAPVAPSGASKADKVMPPKAMREPSKKPSQTRAQKAMQKVVEQSRDKDSNALGHKISRESRFVAWAIDFLFVTASLAMAMIVATVISSLRSHQDTSIFDLAPVHWISRFAPYQILMGVYAIFLVYGLSFRAVLGQTFGESLFVRRSRSGRRVSAL